MNHQQFGCAASTYRRLVALEANSAQDQYLLGFSLYADGKAAEALAPLERSTTLDPEPPQTGVILALALDATKDRQGAELQWQLVSSKGPQLVSGVGEP